MAVITRTAIDARALIDSLDDAPRINRRSHSELTRMLQREGCLLFTDATDQQELVAAIKRQGPEIRDMWLVTLKRLHANGRFIPMKPAAGRPTSTLCAERPLPSAASEFLDLIVVSSKAAEQPEFQTKGYFQRSGEPELVILDVLNECDTLRRSASLRDSGNFPHGTPRESIWGTLLKPLARISSEVTVHDRYFLKNALQGGLASHVTWLVRKFAAEMPSGARVRLLAEYSGGRSEHPSTEATLQRLLGSTPIDIQVTLSPWDAASEKVSHLGSKGPHNRHARFSCGIAVTSYEGFDRLSSNTVWGNDGFTWEVKHDPEAVTQLANKERFVLTHDQRFESLHLAR